MIPDVRFFIFAAARRSISCLLIYIQILLHPKTLFSDGYKEKILRKKYKILQELEKGKSTKEVAAKFHLPGSSLHGRKVYDTFKTSSLSR